MSSLLAQGPAQIEAPPIDYTALMPLLIVLAAACIAVLVEAFLPRYQRWPAQVVLSVVAFTLLYGYLVAKRMELLALEEGFEERELQRAIDERLELETV